MSVLLRATLCLNAVLIVSVIFLEEEFQFNDKAPVPSYTSAREFLSPNRSEVPPSENSSSVASGPGVRSSTAWHKEMERRFAHRNELVRARCAQIGKYPHSEKLTRHRSLYYAFKYNLLVCVTAKTAATTWKTHLLRIMGVREPYSPNPHVPKYHRKIHAKTLMGDGTLRRLLGSPSATRVMTVRHPLARLVSAYCEKFNGGFTSPDIPTWVKYTRKYCKECKLQNGTVTFVQFLNMVLREKNEKSVTNLNSHWRPYSATCSPCNIHYDYIFRQETFEDDLAYLTQLLHIKEIKVKELTNNLGSIRCRATYTDYYKSVPHSVLQEILKLYQNDFLIFDYKIPSFLSNDSNINQTVQSTNHTEYT